MSTERAESSETKSLIKTAILVAIVWTLLAGGSLGWNLSSKRQEILLLASKVAFANIGKDISFRSWVASHSNNNSATTENTSSPRIKRREFTTTDGRELPQMDPASVMHQVHELDSEHLGIHWKITSLKLLNPQNAPDAWETRALKTFETGNREFSELQTVNGKPVLRAMVALVAEQDCLQCHARQGYKKGDVRGGLGTMISMDAYLDSERYASRTIIVTHGIIWLLVSLAIYFVSKLMLQRTRERLKVALELKNSHMLLQTVADYATEWTFWRNPDGNLRYVSPACEKICGYSVDELIARPALLTEMAHRDDRNSWEQHLHTADADGHPKPLEYRILTKQGQLRWISHACRSIYDEDGKFIGVRGTNTDVTDRRHEDELLMLQSRHAAMGEMVSNIAHQWRQPLSTLGLIIQNLRRDYEDNQLTAIDVDTYTKDAYQLIQNMSATIDDFRSFFRPNKGMQPVNLKQSVTSALHLLGATFTSHGIEVSVEIAEDLCAYGYPNEYSQVLLNILSNAKDAIVGQKNPHGHIEIYGLRDENQAVLRIRDNGGGIPNQMIDKMFDPYLTTKPDGTGIGLYMSRIIIERNMGGSISVCNTEAGAEFTIRCPIFFEQ